MTWEEFMKFWNKYGIHIEAIAFLLLLSMIWVHFYNDMQIKKEINVNCGWGEEDYYCYCEKSEAMRVKNLAETGGHPGLDLPDEIGGFNVSLAG